MFEQLIHSAPHRRVEPLKAGVVAAFHLTLIYVSVRATLLPEVQEVIRRVDLMEFVPPAPVARSETTPRPSEEAFVAASPALSLPDVPTEPPTALPPLSRGFAIDPELLRRSLGNPGTGVQGSDSSAALRVMAEAEVDQPASVVSQPTPRYPRLLQEAGLEGSVLVEFVIDTLGHVETGSIRVLDRSHEGFEAAALETIARSLFRPARYRGQAVRQRAMQSVAFRMRRELD